MVDVDLPFVRRNAEQATVPEDRLLTSEHGPVGPATKSDRAPQCELREGHRVHFIATTDDPQDEDPEVQELHCADPHCSHHNDFPAEIKDTTDIDPDDFHPEEGTEYEDANGFYVGEAVLLADFDDPDNPGLGLTDVELATYKEQQSLPTP